MLPTKQLSSIDTKDDEDDDTIAAPPIVALDDLMTMVTFGNVDVDEAITVGLSLVCFFCVCVNVCGMHELSQCPFG
jgi:hypothetical protein